MNINMLRSGWQFSVITTALLCFAFHNAATAQDKWKPGYVVTVNKDTVRGMIAYLHSHKSPHSIKFRKADEESWISFLPKDLILFMAREGAQEIYYYTITAELDFSEIELARINTSPVSEMVKREFFGQLLFRGKKSIYYYQDDSLGKKHYLVEYEVGKWCDLKNKQYFLNDSKVNLLNSQEYIKQVLTLVSDCHNMDIPGIFQLELNEKKIVALFKKYNSNCSKTAVLPGYEFKEEKLQVAFGVIAGMNRTSIHISGQDVRLDNMQFSKYSGIEGGVYINFISPRTENAWSFYNEILYDNYKIKGHNTSPDINGETWDAEFSATYVKLFTMIRYQYPYMAVKPFAEFGIVNGLAMKSSSIATSNPGYPNPEPFLGFRKYEQSYCLGLGVTYHNFGLESRLEKGNGMSAAGYIQSATTYLHVLLNYRLL